jgi:hypothetical protein
VETEKIETGIEGAAPKEWNIIRGFVLREDAFSFLFVRIRE